MSGRAIPHTLQWRAVHDIPTVLIVRSGKILIFFDRGSASAVQTWGAQDAYLTNFSVGHVPLKVGMSCGYRYQYLLDIILLLNKHWN
jgi:hypothetical protein